MFELSTDLTCIVSSTWRVFSGTRLELVTHQPRVHYLDHWATAATTSHEFEPSGGMVRKYLGMCCKQQLQKEVDDDVTGSSESVQEFAARINKLGTQIFQSSNTVQNTAARNANDQLLQSRFISGLRNDIRRFVLARDPNNLEESINAALIEEQNVKLNEIANDERTGLSPLHTETSVISALTNKLEEINLRVERLQEASSVTARKTGGVFFAEGRLSLNVFIVALTDISKRNVGRGGRKNAKRITNPPGETPRANFLFSVNQTLIISTNDASITTTRLFVIITQPPGIRQTVRKELPVGEKIQLVSEAIREMII
ncbi:hypothetical protein TNCV_2791441 [Trichonephila clavipes]|nr:hypothetical protein TNCV_2791441 [Trichonephila clavipes]